MLIPSTEAPGQLASFVVECYSDDVVDLQKIAHVRRKQVESEWRGATAGLSCPSRLHTSLARDFVAP